MEKIVIQIWKNHEINDDDFKINEKVLIPRPDTELIIEQVLKIYKNKDKINFLDIGVGSGAILLSILKEKKGFFGTGIDISNKCIFTVRAFMITTSEDKAPTKSADDCVNFS